ncbi:uncharacterized protein J3D65DRAFT_602057 [Phyllosticta citribraziliensis]|uniref:Uncharacterized protein n=1 Tax=Phyllosticta citribraziliensis TaxID=989973 RepID=A0ABR1LY32_9PEZI
MLYESMFHHHHYHQRSVRVVGLEAFAREQATRTENELQRLRGQIQDVRQQTAQERENNFRARQELWARFNREFDQLVLLHRRHDRHQVRIDALEASAPAQGQQAAHSEGLEALRAELEHIRGEIQGVFQQMGQGGRTTINRINIEWGNRCENAESGVQELQMSAENESSVQEIEARVTELERRQMPAANKGIVQGRVAKLERKLMLAENAEKEAQARVAELELKKNEWKQRTIDTTDAMLKE